MVAKPAPLRQFASLDDVLPLGLTAADLETTSGAQDKVDTHDADADAHGGSIALVGPGLHTSQQPFFGGTRYSGTFSEGLLCVDGTDGRLIVQDGTSGLIKQSGWTPPLSWSGNKTLPADTTWQNVGVGSRFGDYLYFPCKATSDGLVKIRRTPPAAGNTAFTWSGALLTLASGSETMLCHPSVGNGYLFACEYGNPVGGPSAFRISLADANGVGTNWERIYGPDAAIKHIHDIRADPYNLGHVWMTVGDGTGKAIQFSDDDGATWTTVAAATTWQAVQISFSEDWVFFASDVTDSQTVFVIDRVTMTPYGAATNYHGHIAYSVPSGSAGDQFYRQAWYGCVDPDTGIYYCTAVSGTGNKKGVFYLSHVGGRLELIATPQSNVHLIANGYLYMGDRYMALFDMTRP